MIVKIKLIDHNDDLKENFLVRLEKFLDTYNYDIAILDIQGVKGFELLEMANQRGIPALMLTAHALTPENLKKSAEEGAAYYAPKDEINNIATFVADVIEAKEKDKNPWVKWFERLGGWFDVVFTGPNWREREKEFWDAFDKKHAGARTTRRRRSS